MSPRHASLLGAVLMSLVSEPVPAAQQAAPPAIGPAPAFVLTNQDGNRVASGDMAGTVVVVDFIFTTCADSCPLQTEKLARLKEALGADFGTQVRFVSISIDPARDTPPALARYAERHRVRTGGWTFLTGTTEDIRRVARGYGVAVLRDAANRIAHNSLTTLVDRTGTMRIQYAGTGYRTSEMRADILSLLRESPPVAAAAGGGR
jgi:protein SCO1